MGSRTLASASAAVAVILAIVAANLWRELHFERQLTSALREQLAGPMVGQVPVQLPAPGTEPMGFVPPRGSGAPLVAVAPQPVAAATMPEPDAGEQEWMKDLEYRKARRQTDGYATALASAGAPLDNHQIGVVARVVYDEQKSLKQDILDMARKVDLANPQTQMDAQYALRRRQADSNQRIFDALYPWLSAQQMYLLRAQIEQPPEKQP